MRSINTLAMDQDNHIQNFKSNFGGEEGVYDELTQKSLLGMSINAGKTIEEMLQDNPQLATLVFQEKKMIA